MNQVLTREYMAMEKSHRTYPKSRIRSSISRGPPQLPVAGMSRMLWMLWLISLGTIHLSTPVECTPVDVQVHHGFAMPKEEIVTTRFNVQSPSVCRTLCLVQPECKAVTIYKQKTGIDCWFHDKVMRIGHLEENRNAMTLLISYNGSLTCDKPFRDVHGVGCVYLVNSVQRRSDSRIICTEMGSVMFTADTPKHLERLTSHYLSFVQVDSTKLWMNILRGYWLDRGLVELGKGHAERKVEPAETEDSNLESFMCAYLNVESGKIKGSFCPKKGGTVCEKKHPL